MAVQCMFFVKIKDPGFLRIPFQTSELISMVKCGEEQVFSENGKSNLIGYLA